MKATRFLWLACGVALIALVSQVWVRYSRKPTANMIATWHHRPSSLREAKALSNLIVTGKVVKIERAADFVANPPGEMKPLRLQVEVVTIAIQKIHKGGPEKGKKRPSRQRWLPAPCAP